VVVTTRKFKTLASAALSVCFLTLPLFGCSSSNKSSNPPNNPQGQNLIGQNVPQGQNLSGQNLQGSPPSGTSVDPRTSMLPKASTSPLPNKINQTPAKKNIFDKNRAEMIKKQVLKIRGIKSANVIVKGKDALVSYKTSTTKKDKATQDKITMKVKESDKTIKNVYASNSTALSTGVRQLAKDMVSNKSETDLATKFTNLILTAKTT
jgi:hypothetical protein